jgi:hypothetical protein
VIFTAIVFAAWFWYRNSSSQRQSGATDGPIIIKKPVNFANRTFDPDNPPSDMPAFSPGELAVCDSDFLSNADVAGEANQTDSTHAIVTVTKVTMNLQLNITIWVPASAAQHVLEHEQGHREISEHFYETADKLGAKIASAYIGKKFSITGADLQSELSKSLLQMGAEITQQYDRELNPNPTQLRYDAITDHSRNDVSAKDAVAQALSENATGSTNSIWRENIFAFGVSPYRKIRE